MIFLIRHGETAANAARIVQTPDTPLSERGLAQAEALARRVTALGVAAIVSSDLPRALMTAERLQAATTAPLTLESDLQERNFGDLRGRAYATFDVDILAPTYEPPGGESWAAFHARVDAAWARLVARAAETPGNLAVVTHGLVCRAISERHLALDGATCGPWQNASLTVVEPHAPWRVQVLNCTAHLAP